MMYHRRLLVALLVLLMGPLQACRTANQGSPAGEGSLKVVNGTCKVTFKTETKTHVAGAVVSIPMGALLETDDKGTAVVNWGKTSQILQKNTRLTYVAASPIEGYGVSKVELFRGVASFFLPKSDAEAEVKFQAASHSIVAAVKGTIFEMSANEDTKEVTVTTIRGTVTILERKDDAPATPTCPAGTGAERGKLAKGDVYYEPGNTVVFAATSSGGAGFATSPVQSSTPPSGSASPGGAKVYNAGVNAGAYSDSQITAFELTHDFLLQNAILNF